MKTRDEDYILDLCDEVLQEKSARQYRGFAFLTGDTGRRLPVDAYYASRNLVVECHERQHTEDVTFFDKPSKMTCSGVSRKEQRRIYDDRRRSLLPANQISLVILDFSMFECDAKKRLRRGSTDEIVIRKMLLQFLPGNPADLKERGLS